MKTRKIILILTVSITLFCASTIYAQTVNVGNSSFTIPEGYTITENNSNEVKISNDTYNLRVYSCDKLSKEDLKEKYLNESGFLINEQTYYLDGIEINRQDYALEDANYNVYLFKKNDKNHIIILYMDAAQPTPDNNDNPVTKIIQTLK